MRPLAEVPAKSVFFALLLTAFAHFALAQGRWQKFSAPDGDFAVEFPTTPQRSSVPEEQGGSTVEVYEATAGKHSYGVAYLDARQPVDGTSPASVKSLADGCGLSARSLGRKLLRVRRLPGGIVECLTTGPSGNDLYPTDNRMERNFVRGRRYYTLSVISWAAGGVDAASASRFFSSFKLSSAMSATPTIGPRPQQASPP